MRALPLCVALLCACSGAMAEDLEIDLKFDQSVLLQFEKVTAFVTIHNDSDEPFLIDGGHEDARLRFAIERTDKGLVKATEGAPIIRKLSIMPDETRTVMVDVSQWYDVSSMGDYFVTAVIDWKGRMYLSNKKVFGIVRGLELANVRERVPDYPEIERDYSLKYWTRNEAEYLFLSVYEEGSHLSFGVFQLGPLVRVFKPEMKVDRRGNVVVYHQSGKDCFTRSVLRSTWDEVVLVDQTYHRKDGTPYPGIGGAARAESPEP